MKEFLGIELGSTRMKAVSIDETGQTCQSGDYSWESTLENGVWTYDLSQAVEGLRTALAGIEHPERIAACGISGMMHGYLVFDKNWNLLAPFRTWRNTMTAKASEEMSALLCANIPQRWSIAHLYQALLNKEEHINKVAHITTLSGYMHYLLTGENVVGLGEASGMFPVDSDTLDFDAHKMQLAQAHFTEKGASFNVREVFPKVLPAGTLAGRLTEQGAELLRNRFPVGLPFVAPEGDAATGMVATNAVAERTGNISAGTSIFAMVVLEKALQKVYEEIDIITTPTGKQVAMVHCINCSGESNLWVKLFKEVAALFGTSPSTGELFTKLYLHSLEGDGDCGGVLSCNYLAGEHIPHLNSGVPMVAKKLGAHFTLANFMRSQLYASIATLKIGMEILEQEKVQIDRLTGHGGLFKTPGVMQRYLASALNTNISVMETAGEGGAYGMALLAAYLLQSKENESLEDFLNRFAFANAKIQSMAPEASLRTDFLHYMDDFKNLLNVERCAVKTLNRQ